MKYVKTLLPPTLVRDTLGTLGISIEEEKGDEFWALCPRHRMRTGRADRKPSWSINAETGLHSCFSCHYKGNLYTLVVDLKGRPTANDFWKNLDAHGLPIPEGYRATWDFERPTETGVYTVTAKTMRESELAVFTDPPDWALRERRIDQESCAVYGVRWDSDSDAWILPFRDPRDGNLIGWQSKYQNERKFVNYPPGLSKKGTFFGYQEALAASQESVVVVESPLDAVLLFRVGHNAVAVCGSRVSDEQMGLLQEFDSVVFALDNDDAGRTEHDRITRTAKGLYYRIVEYLGDEKDFGEMSDDDIRRVLHEHRHQPAG
jgi:DNA primase